MPWHGVRYGYFNGVWYQPYGAAYVVARPPVGIVVAGLPAFATAVTIGGVGYLYANGVYYRDRGDSSYEVVPSPEVVSTANHGGPARTFVYPKLGQSAEKQASDEYECHRWAVDQTGFDPSAAAAGQGTGPMQRSDYMRALRGPVSRGAATPCAERRAADRRRRSMQQLLADRFDACAVHAEVLAPEA